MKIGKGLVGIDKVRVYHHFWGKFLPSRIKLNWNDDDAMPFVCYLDQKVRLFLGASDERHSDLFSKMERMRFNYPDIFLMGRIWKRRKMIVIDKFFHNNQLSKYVYLDEFLEIAGHYVEGIRDYNLIFKESESCNEVYMDTINEVYDKCLSESHHVPTCNHKGMQMKLSLIHVRKK